MYSYPCSSSLLKMFKVLSLSKQYEVWNISSVFCKNVLLKQSLFSIKMFSVVDFPDEESCKVIPTSWLTDRNHKTFYPQYKGTRFWKAVTTFETPKSCWKTHSCRVLYQTDLLTKAKSKRDGYQYLDTDEIQTGTEVIENQINKRKRFPNQRYASKSASEISSDEASLSSENDDKIDRNRNFISKNKFQCRKKSKPLPEPEPIKLPTSNDNIQNIDKEMSSHSSVLKTAARVATTSQPRANTSLSEGQITKFVITFEDIKYDIGSIKKDIKCIKNKLFSDNVTEEKLPEETETLIPALSLRNLSTFNELLKQKSVFALYVNHFRRFGGTSQADHTRRILRRIVHNELAQKLNWAGRGAKTSLQSFDAVCQLILRSASTNQETSYKITEETIKSWLRYAMDRDGGRNRRKETINNNQTDESQSENYTS